MACRRPARRSGPHRQRDPGSPARARPRRPASRNSSIDAVPLAAKRRLAVLAVGRAFVMPSPNTTLPARCTASANAWSAAGSADACENTMSKTMTAAPAYDKRSVSSAMRERGHGSGSWKALIDSRSIPDDDDLLVGRRAGEQRIGSAPLEAREHLGRQRRPTRYR